MRYHAAEWTFAENKIPCMKDHRFFNSIPANVVFKIESAGSHYILKAWGYGLMKSETGSPDSYGNGCLHVSKEHLEEYLDGNVFQYGRF